MAKKEQDSLKEIVGEKVYSVWLDMLRRLVPDGRTHRLAIAIASMLQYASEIVYEKYGDDAKEGSAAYSLLTVSEILDYDESVNLLLPIIEKLFKDAEMKCKRVNRRSEEYSIAENVVREYINWHNMPWEN